MNYFYLENGYSMGYSDKSSLDFLLHEYQLLLLFVKYSYV